MGWFKRDKEGITTPSDEKKETPEGLWHKCPKCKVIVEIDEHERKFWVCDNCGFHNKVNAAEYFSFLFDGRFKELDKNLKSGDPLTFQDTKAYKERYAAAVEKTQLKEAVSTAVGKLDGHEVVIGCMNFNFIGGSMGSVVGEKIARGMDYALKYNLPFVMISKSGGARMMEAAFSLMQMAKTSAKIALMNEKKLPYISILTNPTTGGVTASFAMLGDINIAEPGALIGFAGPRVVKETIGKDLPEGFQTSEFLLEHGFLDFIVERKNLKPKLSQYLRMVATK